MEKKLNDAQQFFLDYPVYRRLFLLFKKKYQSLGKIGGTVNVADFSSDDLEHLASFFGMTSAELLEKGKGKVSLLAFERQLRRTKFEGISLVELLEHFFDEKILSNTEVKNQKTIFFLETFKDLIGRFPEISFWLVYLKKKSADTYWIYRIIEEKPGRFNEYVSILHEAFENLPEEAERMPMFSQRISQNPHAFDINTELGKLWLHLLAVHDGGDEEGDNGRKVPSDSEGINLLLEKYRLFRDDITNFVTAVNILGETSEGVHPVWEAAVLKKVPSVLNIPIRELTSIIRAYLPDRFDGKNVWVVENSGVFSTILDRFPNAPLICTHGQFKLATLKLLDLLVKEGYHLMYAGDFDPEGVLMLQRLMQRYEGQVFPWRMDAEHYFASDPAVPLSEDRLAKLNNITTVELKTLKNTILTEKKAGYQEGIVSLYFEDLRL
ncbi:TIGR02679 family protein [Evansella sp. AB-P1]|uniref:TIGR02679 family protein n=1 Tax=Evansella sp. AB-P1 TaxID=3037653 RepID=UPI00241C61A8|nr:TIGR02679 family protein [Evansella sp. AB-P1]MDG5789881.1 TIGR02679 family protein [Evansella sp. AB-P1]